MATTRITALAELAEVPADDDVFALEDVSAGTTKRVTSAHVRSGLAATADLATVGAAVAAHGSRTDNPHGVTAAQAGAIPATSGAATPYVSAASEAAAGISELATLAETVAGTDTARVVTVAAARQAVLSWARDNAGKFPGLVVPPSLNLFCRDQASDAAPAGTFTRSTANLRLGQGGLLESVAAGSIRREWGYDGTLYGWRLEAAGSNLLLYSEQVDNAAWTKYGCTVTANAVTSPIGDMTMDKVVEDTSTGASHGVAQAITATSGTAYTLSIFAKAAERSWLVVRTYGTAAPTSGAASYFDLTNGVKGSVAASHSATMTSIGNGIYKISVAVTAAATDSLQVRVLMTTGNGTATYDGNGVSGMYMWGGQIEAGPFPTSHIPTTTASVARSADVWTVSLATSWFNTAAGTAFVAGRTPAGAPASGAVQVLAQYDDGTASNRLRLARDAQRTLRCTVTAAGSTIADLDLGVVADLAALRVACAWSASGLAVCRDASAVTTSAVTIPTGLTTHRIGSDAAGASQWNGHVLHDAHFPVAMSASQLQAITL